MKKMHRFDHRIFLFLIVPMLSLASLPVSASPGKIENISIRSAALKATKQVRVYLPGVYSRQPNRRFPVIVALHGLGGSERDFFAAGVPAALDRAIAKGVMPPAIMVAPDGDNGYWTNHLSRSGRPGLRYGDYVVTDVIKAIDKRYRTLRHARHRALVGVSMGGYGAFSLVLQHPDVFGAGVSLSGALFPRAPTHRKLYGKVWGRPPNQTHWRRSSPIDLIRKLRKGMTSAPALYIHCGDKDPLGFYAYAKLASRLLKKKGIAHVFSTTPGGRHSWRIWKAETSKWLDFVGRRWRKSTVSK
jgi:putative tributyrin esterase